MSNQNDSFSYYANLIDRASNNQNKYQGSEDMLQYFSDQSHQKSQGVSNDFNYYENIAKQVVSDEVNKSSKDEKLYGFVPGEWLPTWAKVGYNNSIEGLAYQIATGGKKFDISRYEEENIGVVGDVLSTITSFFTLTDIGTMAAGGGIGGFAVRGATKRAAVSALQKGSVSGLNRKLATDVVEELVETNAVKASQVLSKQGGVTTKTANELIDKIKPIVSNRILEEGVKGATGLGFYSGLQSALGQEIQTGDISFIQTLADASKGAVLGGVTAGSGKAMNNYLIKSLGTPKTAVEKIAYTTATKALETAEFGTLSPVMEGELPKIDDYIHAAGVIGGLTLVRKVPKTAMKLAGKDNPLLTTKDTAKAFAEAKKSTEAKEAVWSDRKGVKLDNVEFQSRETSSGKQVDYVKARDIKSNKDVEISGTDFTKRGFARSKSRVNMKNSKQIEKSRRQEVFSRLGKKDLNLNTQEIINRVESITGRRVDTSKAKTGYSQMTPIERVKFLDTLRKESLANKIFKEFKREVSDEYLVPQSAVYTKMIPEFLRQSKNRAVSQFGISTVKDINKADSRGVVLTGTSLQELQSIGLYNGGFFKKLFGQVEVETPTGIKKLRTEKQAKEYFEGLGRRVQDSARQNDVDVKRVRSFLNKQYYLSKKAGVPVVEFRKNYFPNKVKSEYLDVLGSDIFKIISQDVSFEGKGLSSKPLMVEKVNALMQSRSIDQKTKDALEHIANVFQEKARSQNKRLDKDRALAEAFSTLRDDVLHQRFSIMGNVEKSRKYELPDYMYERDARIVLTRYATDLARRIAYVENFGPKGEVVEQRLSALRTLANQAHIQRDYTKEKLLRQEEKFLDQLFDTFTNKIEVKPSKNYDPRAKDFLSTLVDFEVATKIGLGYATIPNLTQTLVSTAVKAGYWNTFKGGYKLSTDKQYRKEVARSGLSTLSISQMMYGLEPTDRKMSRIADGVTKISLFQGINKVNQYVAAAAGREYINSLLKARNSRIGARSNWAKANLRRLGLSENISRKELVREETVKTPEGRKTIATSKEAEAVYRFARDAQLQKNVLNDPLFFNDPRFRPFILFKRFGYKQFNWIREELGFELARGNFLPMLRLGAGGLFGSQLVVWSKKALNNFFAGEDEVYDESRVFLPGLPPNTNIDVMGIDVETDISKYTVGDFLDHIASVGAFGFVTDVIANENKFRALEFLFKPAIIQDALKGIDAFQRIGKDLHTYGIGAYKRSPKYFAPILGTVPRRIAMQFETPGQKETYTRYRKGITRSRILDLFIEDREQEAYRVMDAWNRSNPENQIFYDDVDHNAIFDRVQKQYEKSFNP